MHCVELFPSGRRFEVECGQTLLEAALEAGIAVAYQCTNGSCGDCRARIMEGTCEATGHHDYVFTGADRQHPMLLMCRSHPTSDMTLQVVVVGCPTDIPHQRIATTVRSRELLNGNLMVLTLRTPRSNTLRFLAGQQVELRLPGIGHRRMSIASCPCNGRDLQFHCRRQTDDPFSRHLFDDLAVADAIEVLGPYGDLTFDEQSRRPVVLIAFDTGFAAAKSLIEHIISLEGEQPLHLYRLLPGAEPAYLDNQCRAWSDALTSFRYSVLHTTDAAAVSAAVGADHPDLARSDIYLIVPPALREGLLGLLPLSGARADRIRT